MAGAVVVGEARVDKPGALVDPGRAASPQGGRRPAALRLARRAQAGGGAGGLPHRPARARSAPTWAPPPAASPTSSSSAAPPASTPSTSATASSTRGSADDPRVVVRERENARQLTAEALGEPVDLVVGDLSFISLRLILPAVKAILRPGGEAILLVKPQFEVGKGEVGKGGVVRDDAKRRAALEGGGRRRRARSGSRCWATPSRPSRGRPATASGCWPSGGRGSAPGRRSPRAPSGHP